jgi:hypothetical protein
MMFYRPVVWLGARRTQVEKLRQSLRRYCEEVLGDPSPIVDVIPAEELPDMLIVPIVVSSGFKKMSKTECVKSVLDFLFNDSNLTTEDRSGISHFIIQAD